MFTTLLDVKTVSAHFADPDWVVVDCRFSLADTHAGRYEYEAGHIPGALYAHLDNELSSAPVTDNGRHPLPAPETLRDLFGRMGISRGKQVVVYDNANGAIAARLWWMLRYMGHMAVAVLDGGWQAWEAAQLPTTMGIESPSLANFSGNPRREWLILHDEVPTVPLLIDSRQAER